MRVVLPLLLAGCTAKVEVGDGLTAEGEAPADPAAPGEEAPPDAEPDPPAPCPLTDGALPLGPEGAFLARDTAILATRERCAAAWHAGAGAAGSTLRLTLESWGGPSGAELAFTDLLGDPLAEPIVLQPGDSATVALDQSGEVLARLSPADPDEDGGAYSLSLTCVEGCELRYTRYPLVLMHGMGGTDSYFDLVDYWVDLDEILPEAGYHVEIHAVSAFDTVEDRAAQWREVLDALQAAGVGRKFNLIGHSQGGLDARYLAGALEGGSRIASIVTIASPHHGSPVADLTVGALDLGLDTESLDAIVDAAGSLFGLGGDELTAQIAGLSSESMAAFNEDVPDAPGVYYASWAGRTCGYLDGDCQAEMNGDMVPPLLWPTYTAMLLAAGDNDGMVTVESAQWGEFMGVLAADHGAEVGVELDWFEDAFDHEAFYLSEANRLFELGF